MPEGLPGGILGDVGEKSQVVSAQALTRANAFLAAAAAGASRQGPQVPRHAPEVLRGQMQPRKAQQQRPQDAQALRLALLRYQPHLRAAQLLLLAIGMLAFGGCAGYQGREPIQVIMVGVDPLQGEGLELRMLVKLRIQNPNDSPLEFNGLFIQMDVQGKSFATGVSDAAGSIARYGETIVAVPVSISAFRIARQAIGVMTNEYHGKLTYEIRGRLAGPAFNGARFRSKGEFTLPADIAGSDK
jgi:LEA14-like dessication related protein